MNAEIEVKVSEMRFYEKDLHLIHFGSKEFKSEKFYPIHNAGWNKPVGGLWTSPVVCDYGWRDWCHSENFRTCDYENAFTLKLVNRKVILIDSLKDLESVPSVRTSYGTFSIDFEHMLKEGVDAIYLTENGQSCTRFSRPQNLYGWDCECVLILNPDSLTF